MSKSENVILTVLCMVYSGEELLILNNKKSWKGLTFPGGHVEKDESFVKAVKREVFEETGLSIYEPKLCGIKQFLTEADERYIVILFKTDKFSGKLISSEEGEVSWMRREELDEKLCANGFLDTLKAFDDDSITEMKYERSGENPNFDWHLSLY